MPRKQWRLTSRFHTRLAPADAIIRKLIYIFENRVYICRQMYYPCVIEYCLNKNTQTHTHAAYLPFVAQLVVAHCSQEEGVGESGCRNLLLFLALAAGERRVRGTPRAPQTRTQVGGTGRPTPGVTSAATHASSAPETLPAHFHIAFFPSFLFHFLLPFLHSLASPCVKCRECCKGNSPGAS